MRTRGRLLLANLLVGLALGFTVTRIGFGDYAELNRMFTFQDLRMFFSFLGAVGIIVIAFALLRVRRDAQRVHAGVVPGAVLFGIGWAISGGCPAIPIVQLAGGYLPAVITLAGIVVGVRLARWAGGRGLLRVERGSCGG
ncbi:YeeE/YedE family protein [Streptomyces roseirectus]|uniref:YeeE/YedE family protein n=1 Tax=Streptomyces roseirectus TaxID=2768066 RepID=A0A7H0IFN5_9ACTN|nr:YeeE/YedE thiosulfate transporter family protein [Streptomyces roseirectus]QNP71601.1 YeeE/YedE family protein [Streptomyces roseirectus]